MKIHHFLWAMTLTIVGVCQTNYSVASDGVIIDRVSAEYIDGKTFVLDVIFLENAKDDEPNRVIKIRCTAGCKNEDVYEERFSDSPISIFRLNDRSHLFISISSGGSTYWIRVYDVRGEVRKVFEQATRSTPQFVNGGGELESDIILYSPGLHPYGDDRNTVWHWNGKKYIEQK